MTATSPGSSAPPPAEEVEDEDLSRTYTLVFVVEIIVILALYALGRYFS